MRDRLDGFSAHVLGGRMLGRLRVRSFGRLGGSPPSAGSAHMVSAGSRFGARAR